MSAGGIAAVLAAWLQGYVAVCACWPRERSIRADLGLIVPLGFGVGLGVTSVLFAACSVAFAAPLLPSVACEVLVLGLAAGLGGSRGFIRERPSSSGRASPCAPGAAQLRLLLPAALLIFAVLAWRTYSVSPHGGWDAWAIWNLHARFLFRAGSSWPQWLGQPGLAWTHPDYPLLLPASVARGWTWAGREETVTPTVIPFLLGVASVVLLVSGVSRRRPPQTGLLAGLLLLGTPAFAVFSANQHADAPLAFYVLAALILPAAIEGAEGSRRLSALAGFLTGLSAWMKNEGLLFAAVSVLAFAVFHGLRPGERARVYAFLGGVAVGLLPVLWFKLWVAPPNDLVASRPIERLTNLVDLSRHTRILRTLWRDLNLFGEWAWTPLAAMAIALIGVGRAKLERSDWRGVSILGLLLLGYYAVYLLTHWDLQQHLDSSLVRLLLHVWPAGIYFWCLAATPADRPGSAPEPVRVPRLVRALSSRWANGAVIGATILGLALQQPSNVVASTGGPAPRARLLLGEGWYGEERHGDTRWAWSKGRSQAIVLAKQDGTEVELRFRLRGLGPRTVTVKDEDRVLWHGATTERFQTVVIPGIILTAGANVLEFETEAPGVRESAAASARALTFAVADPELD